MIDLIRQRLASYHPRDDLGEEQAIKEILKEVNSLLAGLKEFGWESTSIPPQDRHLPTRTSQLLSH